MLYGVPTPRRRDAQRNRSAIVQAAGELLLSRAAVLMPEIARRAGVGQATLYRHFPDRHALVAAVVADRLERLEAFVAAGAGRPSGFRDLLGEVLRTQLALRPLVRPAGGLEREARRRAVAALAPPLRRAQAGGEARADLAAEDLALLFAMLAGAADAAEPAGGLTAAAAERSIALLLDGVCPEPRLA
ncbi:TetR/AcrR family transcriptional regulator [Dactylosporangium sp. CA-092794]|uniref:TetR/AcrR family transcriptional regulator n=1 Tax=Dactylosporangium sp. CA-092794 TaxID=3239929 RepID=UPI003D9151C8